jgi:PAS domain S-box
MPNRQFEHTIRINLSKTAALSGIPGSTAGDTNATPRSWRHQAGARDTNFYKLLESVYDAVLITTRDGRILDCNERACSFFRTEISTLAGSNIISLISGATPELIKTFNKNLECDKYTLVEARCKRYDGTSFPGEIAVNKVDLDDQGELCFLVRDITIRTNALNELKAAMERLQAHDRARMEFVSNVSHELRTPLTSMIYAVTNMLRGVVGPMPEKAVSYLERLQSDCNRMLSTVNDILDLRQIENKSLVLTKSVIPIGMIVYDAAESLRVQADAKDIRINMDLPSRELFSSCDPTKMVRVMINIIGNAIKFTPSGGKISVSIMQHPKHPKQLQIAVCDNGPGIPQEALHKISQRYFRVGDHANGSGLGLAISREIIELHGGSMSFASPVPDTDCGTAVYVTLPLATKPLVVTYSANEEMREVLHSHLESRGYRQLAATDSRHILESCIEKLPSVLIIDRRNAGFKVGDLIMQIRENLRTKRLPVIEIGDQDLSRNEIQLFRNFSVFYLQLPWSPEQFAHNMALAVLGKLR